MGLAICFRALPQSPFVIGWTASEAPALLPITAAPRVDALPTTFPTTTYLAAFALAFFAIGVGVLLYQRRATSCPVHQPAAGRIAVATAIVCLMAATTLAIASYLL